MDGIFANFSLIKWGLTGAIFAVLVYQSEDFNLMFGVPMGICLIMVMLILEAKKGIIGQYEED